MRKQNRVVSVLATMVCCMIAFGLALGIAGCGKNDETVIRETITQVLDPFKAPTKETLEPIITQTGVDLSNIEAYGIDPYEFFGHCLSQFDYTIDTVSVDGDAATATLTLKSADISAAIREVQADVTSNLQDYTDIFASEEAVQNFTKTFFDQVYVKLDTSEELVESEAVLRLTKTDGQWTVNEDSVVSLVGGMFGNIDL